MREIYTKMDVHGARGDTSSRNNAVYTQSHFCKSYHLAGLSMFLLRNIWRRNFIQHSWAQVERLNDFMTRVSILRKVFKFEIG